MQFRRSFPGLLLAVCVLAATSAVADGTLTVNGKTVKLNHIYALKAHDPFDKTKSATRVIASDTEVPQGALLDEFEFMRMHFSGVDWLINAEQRVVSLSVHSQNLKNVDQFSSVGLEKLNLTANTSTHLAGRIYLEKPDDFFHNVYQYDISFDAPVLELKAPDPVASLKGTRTPAGGGEPGKAYNTYRKVMMAGDIPALKKSVSKERLAAFDDPDFKKMFPMIQSMQPKNVKITAGSIDGETATLVVEAKDEHETSNGTVTMVREGGAWKVANEDWKSKVE
jgi:hypothetical protein